MSWYIHKSPLPELSPNLAVILSPNFKLLSDLSTTILLPFWVWKVTSSWNCDVPFTSNFAVGAELLIPTLPVEPVIRNLSDPFALTL